MKIPAAYPPEVLNTYPYPPQIGDRVGKGKPTMTYRKKSVYLDVF